MSEPFSAERSQAYWAIRHDSSCELRSERKHACESHLLEMVAENISTLWISWGACDNTEETLWVR